jgi:chromosome segregation ATPase
LEHEKLARFKGQHHALEESHREAEGKLLRAKQAVVRHRREIESLNLSIDRQEVAIQDLKDALEADTPQTGLLEQFDQNLKDAQDTRQINENQYKDLINEKDSLNSKARVLMNQLNGFGEELANIDDRINKAKASLEKAINKREEEVRKSNQTHILLRDARDHKIRLEEERDQQVARVSDFTEQAEQISPRIPVDAGETAESLEAKLNKLQREQLRQREQ